LLQSISPGKRKLALLAGAITLLALVIGLAVAAILYFGSQRPEAKPTTPEVAVQPSAQPTAPVAVAIPSPSIGTTPSKEELARRALDNATKERPWVNSLGMRFVPVAGTDVLFSVWDTRVQDFEMFVKSTGYDATGGMHSIDKDGWKQQRDATWKEPGFSQGSTHPVVEVSWNDAKEFCRWLTKRERSAGDLPEDREYRLPKDEEWSAAAGLKNEVGSNPEEKSGKIKLYPWDIPQKRDKSWPPPAGAGNYAGEEAKSGDGPYDFQVIEGYNDGYPRTSPVGSFEANFSSLYDMGGNVWQWCEDLSILQGQRVLRGASWGDSNPDDLLASYRTDGTPDRRYAFVGFRCVVAVESSR
jgi:formylglycine-generating enzyme required for sulfatase activity